MSNTALLERPNTARHLRAVPPVPTRAAADKPTPEPVAPAEGARALPAVA